MSLNDNNYQHKRHSIFANIGTMVNSIKILMEKRLKEENIDICFAQYIILNIIYSQDKIILEELSKILNKDKSAVLRYINYLNDMFWVAKIVDPKDKRRKVLVLTKIGAEILYKARKVESVLSKELTFGVNDLALNDFDLVLKKISSQTTKIMES